MAKVNESTIESTNAAWTIVTPATNSRQRTPTLSSALYPRSTVFCLLSSVF